MFLWPIQHGILKFVGFDVLPPFVAWAPARATPEERAGCLDQYAGRLRTIETTEPLFFHPNDDFQKGVLKPGIAGRTVAQRG